MATVLLLVLVGVPACVILSFPLVITLTKLRARPAGTRAAPAGSVSLIVPLASCEDHIAENARSYLAQRWDGPHDVLFVAEQPQDESARVVRSVLEGAAGVAARILYAGDPGQSIAKMHNLCAAVRECRSDYLVFVDSDVTLRSEETLRGVVLPLEDPAIGLVTAAPQYYHPRTIGGLLLAAMINADLWGYFALLSVAGRLDVANGAIIALRRSTLDEIGGLSDMQSQILNDTVIARRVLKTGRRVCLFSGPACIEDPSVSVAGWWQQLLRWHIGMRSVLPFHQYLLYGVQRSPVLIGVLAWALWAGTVPGALFLLAPVLARLMSFAAIQLLWHREKSGLLELMIVPLTDLVSPVLWLASWFTREIAWRGRHYSVMKGGTARDVCV